MLAFVHALGNSPVDSDCWKMTVRAGASSWESSFKTLQGKLSGPDAFEGFYLPSSFSSPLQSISMFPILGYDGPDSQGIDVRASCVKTDLNCWFSNSAFVLLSVWSMPLLLIAVTPTLSCLCAFTYFQKGLVSLSARLISSMLFTYSHLALRKALCVSFLTVLYFSQCLFLWVRRALL